MRARRGFDEVMIVNPYDPGADQQGVKLMRFGYAEAPYMGYYSEPPEQYGYYGEDPYGAYAGEPYGYYAEHPYDGYGGNSYGAYGEADVSGYYGYRQPEAYGSYGYGTQEPVGYFAEDPMMGWYGEESYGQDPYGESEPMGWYGEDPYGEDPYGEDPYGESEPMGWYGSVPEMVGYGEGYGDYAAMGEENPPMGYYGESDMSGYVRDAPPVFNPGCPLPTNVAGLGEADTLAGYTKPADVSPSCPQFTSPSSSQTPLPDTLRPLW